MKLKVQRQEAEEEEVEAGECEQYRRAHISRNGNAQRQDPYPQKERHPHGELGQSNRKKVVEKTIYPE